MLLSESVGIRFAAQIGHRPADFSRKVCFQIMLLTITVV